MNQIIRLNIDVTKIDKSRLHKGKKGIYANLTILMRAETDEYGNDGMIVEDVTKEEREAGKKGTIVGNARIVVSQQQQPQHQRRASPSSAPETSFDDEDEIPF